MAALNQGNPTLLDELKRMDPDGAIAKMVEPLKQKTPLLEDMTFREGNLPTGHQFTSRTALPSLGWRKYNEGVAPSKSRSDQVTETCGMLAGQSVVDVQLAKLNGNEAAFRASEDQGFLTAYANTLEAAFFYSSTKVNPQQVMGLSPRLDATANNPAGSQIVKSGVGATGSNTSIWLVAWSPETVYGIYPKGSMAGLEAKDMGEQLIADSGGTNKFRAYVTDWTWKLGFAVQDSRYIARVCNIGISNLAKTGSVLIQDLILAVNQLQDLNTGRIAIYCNRTIMTYLQLQSVDTVKNSTLTYDNVGGKPVLQFMGIPVKRTDAILNNEATIT